MSVTPLRVGVIGLGMGGAHAVAYRELPNAELVGICDISEPWLRHCQEAWAVPVALADHADLLARDNIDAVSVAVPTHLHSTVTIAALRAGKHVLVEKPMATSAREAETMASASRAAGRTLMVSYNQRFSPEVMYLKRYIEEGGLGGIYFARTVWRRPLGMLPSPVAERPTGPYDRNWFNEAARGGGVALDLGSHVIDLALWLMEFPEIEDACGRTYAMFGPAWAQAQGATFDADDHTVGLVRFANGASMQVEVSFGSHTDREIIEVELFGTDGGAVRRAGEPLRLFGSAAGAYTVVEPRVVGPATSPQAEFVNSVLEGRGPLCTAEQGIAAMRIIDALRAGGAPIGGARLIGPVS